jgi:hypothetical protein
MAYLAPPSREGGFLRVGFAAVDVAVAVAVAVGAVPASIAVADVVGAIVVAGGADAGGGGALSAGFLSLTMTQPPRTITATAAGTRSNTRFIETPRVWGRRKKA